MNRREAIKRSVVKTELQLNDTKNREGESVSVGALTPRGFGLSMSTYATRQQVDYGARGAEAAENTTMVTWRPMCPTLTEGVGA